MNADGRSRAYINDQPISVGTLRNIGESLIEIEGQFASHGLIDPANHRDALDAFGQHGGLIQKTVTSWSELKSAEKALAKARNEIDKIAAEGDFLRHVHAELDEFDLKEGEEASLTEARSLMMNAEKIADAINHSLDILSGNKGFQQVLSKSLRALERANEQASGILKPALEAMERTGEEAAVASDLLIDALRSIDQDPRNWNGSTNGYSVYGRWRENTVPT